MNDFYFRLEERDRWYDQSIKYLLFGNGGGVALLMTFIGALSRAGQWIPALIIPLAFFLLGIIPIGFVVFLSAKCAKEGREGVRALLNQYIRGTVTYEDAFLQMGAWPSRWSKTRGALVLSFVLFVAGIGSSALVYYLHPNLAISGPIINSHCAGRWRQHALLDTNRISFASLAATRLFRIVRHPD